MAQLTLPERHQFLLKRAPTRDQLDLYEAFPAKRGYMSVQGLSLEQEQRAFEAVFVAAISQTFVPPETVVPSVFILVPPRFERWAAKSLRNIAEEIFKGFKQEAKVNPRHAVLKAERIGQLYKHLHLGSHLTSQTVQPDHWVAYGFERTAEAPSWVMDALIPVYPFLRDD